MKNVTLALLTIISTPAWAQSSNAPLDWSIACPIFVLVFLVAAWFGVVRPKIKAEKAQEE